MLHSKLSIEPFGLIGKGHPRSLEWSGARPLRPLCLDRWHREASIA
jgi:hypothetical protein